MDSERETECLQVSNMETLNASTWNSNDSSFTQYSWNNSADVSRNNTKQPVQYLSPVFFECVFGLPGNLFVLVIYLRRMTTSIKVYLFALAVADSIVCTSGIVLSSPLANPMTRFIALKIMNAALIFSLYLLVFISVERVFAVRRPHSFSMRAQRTKHALLILALPASVYITVLYMIPKQYSVYLDILQNCILVLSLCTMTICYSIMAVTLLKRARTSGNRVHVQSEVVQSKPESTSRCQQLVVTTLVETRVASTNALAPRFTCNVNAISPTVPEPTLVSRSYEDTPPV